MGRPDSIHSISVGKNEDNFHAIFFEFVADVRQQHFLMKTTPDLMKDYFTNWMSQLDSKITNFNEKEVEELEQIKNFKMKDPKDRKKDEKVEINETKIREFIVEIEDYGFLKFNSATTINKMILIHLIIQFETFIKKTLDLVYHINPKFLKSKKTLEFNDLIDVDDKHEILHLMIDKQIDDLLHQDIEKISDYFEEKTGLKFSDYEKWNDCKERFYRRNIVTHNDGVPNEIYWSKTNITPQDVVLKVDDNYLVESFVFFRSFAHHITDYFEIKFGTKQKDPHKSYHSTPSDKTDMLFFEEKIKKDTQTR